MRSPPTRCTDCDKPLRADNEVRINGDPYCLKCIGKAADRIGKEARDAVRREYYGRDRKR
jgi:hypothetical protein